MAPALAPPRHPGTLPHAHCLASVGGGGAPRLALTGCPQHAGCADRRRVLPPRLNASCRFGPAVAELHAWPNEGGRVAIRHCDTSPLRRPNGEDTVPHRLTHDWWIRSSLHVTALPIAEAPASPTYGPSERVRLSPRALRRASPRRQR